MTKKKLPYCFLAGLIDGDGFIRTYRDTGEYVITVHENDKPLLLQLQKQFGGEIRKVLNKKAIRFCLNSKNAKAGKKTLIELTKNLNSHIRNSVRVEQFKKCCTALGITYQEALHINKTDGYIAGLFCADGSVYLKSRSSRETIRNKKLLMENKSVITAQEQKQQKSAENRLTEPEIIEERIQRLLTGVAPRAEISIASKLVVNIQALGSNFSFGSTKFHKGNQRSPEGHFSFRLYKKEDILKFVEYMKLFENDSIKYKRLLLIENMYFLKSKKAHLLANTFPGHELSETQKELREQWISTIREWFKL